MTKVNAFNLIFTSLKKGPLPDESDLLKIPSYMFCRYLGGHPLTILAANEINKYYKEIPIITQYKMIKSTFAGKNIYPIMLKKAPAEDSLDSLCTHFKISREKAKEYRTFLSDDEFNRINDMYLVKG